MRSSYLFIFIMGCLLVNSSEQAIRIRDGNLSDERAFRIKPHVCTDRHNVQGICMFQWECRQRNGDMLATCLDRFLFGTCCKLPSMVFVLEDSSNSTITKSHSSDHTTEVTSAMSTTGHPLLLGRFPQNVTAASSSHSTPDVEKLFQHFLGNVLVNYTKSDSDVVVTDASIIEEVTRGRWNVTDPSTTSSYMPTSEMPVSVDSLPQILSTTQNTIVDEVATNIVDPTQEEELFEYGDKETNSYEEHLSPVTDVNSETTPSTSPSVTLSTIDVSAETNVPLDESQEQTYADDSLDKSNPEATTEEYDTDVNVADSLEDITVSLSDPATMATTSTPATTATTTTVATTTSTSVTTTTAAKITTTIKQFSYKKGMIVADDRTPLLSFTWIWYSLIRTLLAVPTFIWNWLTGSNAVDDDECYGAVACEPLSSETTSAGIYLPNEAYCGLRPLIPNGRIVGGTNGLFGEWPWQVLIKEATWLGLFVKNKCGGVLLNQRYVVTAAHCQPGFLASLLVIFGENDLTIANEDYKPLQRNVRRVIVHRKYNALTFDNDLALIELDRPVEYQPHVVPICLPPDSEDYTGRTAVVSGWGRIKYGGRLPTTLQYVEVPIMTNSKCQQMFLSAGHIKPIGNKFLCAGYRDGGKDSCEGDSGGPLVLQGEDGRWILAGTVSHGIKCAYPNLPGVYIKISAYKSWIQKIINS